MNICTIIARNYLAFARVLAESFRQVHPDGTCTVLVIDDPAGYFDPAEEAFEVLTIDDIGLPDAERMAAIYDVMELSTAVKPWLMRTLLERPGVEAVSYLDPDIRVFASLEEIERQAIAHEIVLTPHFTKPLPRDGLKPSEEDILIAGTYNLGFIGLGAGKTAHALLDWWSERLETDCINDPAEGHFVDQRWIDLAPGLFPDIYFLRETNYNIAYWNLPTRELEDDGAGGYRVDGQPLRFFHFSGIDPHRPTDLSKHQNRIDLSADPTLAKICGEYGEELLARGFDQTHRWPYGWAEMANGMKLDRPARRLFRDAVEAGELRDSLFTEAGAAEFVDYLTRPALGEKGPVNRYAQAIWEARPDFRKIFPDISGPRAPEYVGWLRMTAPDTGVEASLLPAPPAPGGPSAPGAAPGAEPSGPPAGPEHHEQGVNLVGYLSSERGVGEAARQLLDALQTAAVPTAPVDTPPEPDKIPDAFRDLSLVQHPYDVNLVAVNADMLPAVYAAAGVDFFRERHTIGLWFWEVSDFPDMWRRSFDHVDEVWVATAHIADALKPVSPVPVRTVRLPIVTPAAMTTSRAELGLPEGYTFLFVFDYRSVFRRKNPLGLVEAFTRAFEPGAGPSLVIKSIFGDEFPEQRQLLRDAVADRPDIHLIEETVAAEAKNAMIASCDCYVSLHRSEGLGLTMGEAMYFGRPVIATGYSGNLDFMTEENSFLVRHSMVKIGDDAPPYPPNGEWAEPDLDHAAELMRDAYERPWVAAERGHRGAADLRRTHSVAASGAMIAARVEAIRRRRLAARLRHPSAVPPHPETARDGRENLELVLGNGVAPTPPDASNLRKSGKRVYMRALQPYVSYQQQVNAGLVQTIDELRQALSDLVKLDDSAAAAASSRLDRLADEARRDRGRLDALAEAAAAKPYMADDRLAPREHPVLGQTFGFRAAGAEGEGYRGFEDVFRGSEELIRARQRVYLPLVAGRGPVFDGGCGRGEFLDLLAAEGIDFIGVDLDPTMVARCREKGYENVEEGDMIAALEKVEPGSLGAIFSAQVIEHMPFEDLQRFLELGRSRLRPGGLMIVETVNPHSPAALKAFWVDPTHQHPLFPEVVLELCELAGYASGDVFAPVGDGDWEADRTKVGEYAVVAATPE